MYLQVYDFTSEDLLDLGEIGRGAYGTVNKMYHSGSDTTMAVKVGGTLPREMSLPLFRQRPFSTI